MRRLGTHKRSILRLRRFRGDERGAILVEFGLILPIMLLFFGLMIEGSRLLWSYQAAIAGVRDAGRYLSRVVPADICTTGGTLAGYATKAKDVVEKDIKDNVMFSSKVTINSVTPTYTCEAGTYRNNPVPVVTVTTNMTIQFPLASIVAMFGGGFTQVTTTFADSARIFGQ